MARLLGPDMGSRAVFLPGGRLAAGKTGVVYADAAGISVANIAAYQPGSPGIPGSVITGGVVTVDSYGLLPLFWFPDGIDRVWVSVNGGPVVPIDADYNARLDQVAVDVSGKVPKTAIARSVNDYGVRGDGTEEGAAIQAAISAVLGLGFDVYFPPGTYKCNTGLTIDSTRGSVYGVGQVTLDFTGMSSGTAITFSAPLGSDAFRSMEHRFGSLRILGPISTSTTVDGIKFTSTESSSMIGLREIKINGFRDSVFFDQNTWCINFERVLVGQWARYGLNFDSTTNAGENYTFKDCTFYDARNATTGTAVAVYTSALGNADTSFYGCSFDYNDYAVLHQGGKLNFYGCHFESNNQTPFIQVTRSSSPENPQTSLLVNGGVFVQTEVTGRSHLIEIPATASAVVDEIFISLRDVNFDIETRGTTVFKNLSTAKPRVQHTGCVIREWGAAGIGNAAGNMGHYTSLVVNGDFEGSTTFNPSSAFPMYPGQNWARDGAVTYTFDTAVKRSGTTSLKMVGTGAVANTGLKQMISVIPGRELLVSLWIKIETITGGSTKPRVRWILNDHTTVVSTPYDPSPLTAVQDWTCYRGKLIVPPGITLALIEVLNANLNGTAYVDDAVATMP